RPESHPPTPRCPGLPPPARLIPPWPRRLPPRQPELRLRQAPASLRRASLSDRLSPRRAKPRLCRTLVRHRRQRAHLLAARRTRGLGRASPLIQTSTSPRPIVGRPVLPVVGGVRSPWVPGRLLANRVRRAG